MIENALPTATKWSPIDRNSSPVLAIGLSEAASRSVESAHSNLVFNPSERSTLAGPTVAPEYRLPRLGRIEKMAAATQQLSPPRSRILGVLLKAANPESCGGNSTLQPLWVNETMHRAYQTVRLTRLLDARLPCRDHDPAELDLEWRVAGGLAEALHSLRIARDSEKLPCSEVLRDVVRDLVELFGEAVGIADISTRIEPMKLASFKRRALTLMAGHFVIELLLRAFRERSSGQILVTLDRPCRWLGRLTVSYYDHVVPFGPPDWRHGVIDDLASLLESEVVYHAGGEQIVAAVEFPIR